MTTALRDTAALEAENKLLRQALIQASKALRVGSTKTQGSGLMVASDLFSACIEAATAAGIHWETGLPLPSKPYTRPKET
jgi:hypothetical protein